jgi:shikimate 5-dehydrogenase
MYFVGVSTRSSFINRLFPVWAQVLKLPGVVLEGIDLPINPPPELCCDVVRFIRDHALAVGALVTTHKVNIYLHTRDLFDSFDPYAKLLGEISSISKRDSNLIGHAKDPISSGLALRNITGENYWAAHPAAQVLILGSGGSALALAAHLLEQPRGNVPDRIILTGRTPARVDYLCERLKTLDSNNLCECKLISDAQGHDKLIESLLPYSLVANATGMGKDRPGSPVTDSVSFPEHGITWDFNYRGELKFLDQARRQQALRNLTVEDGWVYFLHGWSQVISEVFHLSLDRTLFEKLADAANRMRGNG